MRKSQLVRFEWTISDHLVRLRKTISLEPFDVSWVKTEADYEVDFLARSLTGDEALIQVCAALDAPAMQAREVRVLQDAAQTRPHATLHLIAMDYPARIQLPDGIQLHRASQWLLGTR